MVIIRIGIPCRFFFFSTTKQLLHTFDFTSIVNIFTVRWIWQCAQEVKKKKSLQKKMHFTLWVKHHQRFLYYFVWPARAYLSVPWIAQFVDCWTIASLEWGWSAYIICADRYYALSSSTVQRRRGQCASHRVVKQCKCQMSLNVDYTVPKRAEGHCFHENPTQASPFNRHRRWEQQQRPHSY